MCYLDEFQFINKIKQQTYKQPSLVKGIGDDAAVFQAHQSNTVIATDTFVENIHFTSKTMTLFHVGYRALAANLSDLAAMNATPTYYLVSIVIPDHYTKDNVAMVYDGLEKLASVYKMDLIGGDTVSGDQFVLSVTVIGTANKQKIRYRHTAKNNDVVFVTGTLGDSRAGLHLLMNDLNPSFADYFIKRHRMPEPRIEFSQMLSDINRVTLNDVSDGIASEAAEIAEASDKTIVFYDEYIPVHYYLHEFTQEQQANWKFFGGEDFELLGTVSKDDWPLVQKYAQKTNIQVTEIGYVTHLKDHLVYVQQEEKLEPLQKRGYTHLK